MVDGIEKDKKEKPSVLYKSCNSTGNDNVKLRKITVKKYNMKRNDSQTNFYSKHFIAIHYFSLSLCFYY